jgi:hypothetical protein
MSVNLSEYKARNLAALESVGMELAAAGFEMETEDLALRCVLRLGKVVTGYAYFVSAAFMFSLEQQPASDDEDEIDREHREQGRRHFEIDLRRFQHAAMGQARKDKQECRLFVIAEEAVLGGLDMRKRGLIENDETTAIQRVCTLAQARAMLVNPFPVRERADVALTFDAVQDVTHLAEAAPAVDLAVSQAAMYEEPDAGFLASEAAAEVRARIAAIFCQVAGPEFKFFWSPEGVSIGRVWDSRGCPMQFAGAGEQRVFAFAYFLATKAMALNPGQRIGMYGLLNGLCLIWFVGAVNVLRQFSHSTGVSVRLAIPQRERRDVASAWMKHIATVIETRKYPYNI